MTALLTFVPDVSDDTAVFAGLFLVTAVGFAVKFAVDHVTEVLHDDAPIAIVHAVGEIEIVPEGVGQAMGAVPETVGLE
jgi:hypothetical protein